MLLKLLPEASFSEVIYLNRIVGNGISESIVWYQAYFVHFWIGFNENKIFLFINKFLNPVWNKLDSLTSYDMHLAVIWNILLERLLEYFRLWVFKIILIIYKLVSINSRCTKLSFSAWIYLLTVSLNAQDNGAAIMLSRQYIGCFVCGIVCCQRKFLGVVKASNCMAWHYNSKFKNSFMYMHYIFQHIKLLLQFWYFS